MMNQLVDLDKLLDEFQKQEAESRTTTKEANLSNYIKPKPDDTYACLIGITPAVSKPLYDIVPPNSPIIREMNYHDKSVINKCTNFKDHELEFPTENHESLDRPTFSSPISLSRKDDVHIKLDAKSSHETHRDERSVTKATLVDQSAQESNIYFPSLKAKSNQNHADKTSVDPAERLQSSSESRRIGLVDRTDLRSSEVLQRPDTIDRNADHRNNEDINTNSLSESVQAPPSSSPVISHSPLASISPPEWAADASSSVCVSCCSKFTVLRRRHHCRTCGRLLCSTCTPHRVPLPPSFANHIPVSPSSPEESLLRLVAGSGSSSTSGTGGEEKLHRVCTDCFRNVFGRSSSSENMERAHQQSVTSPQTHTHTSRAGGNISQDPPSSEVIPTTRVVDVPAAMAPPVENPRRGPRILPALALQRLKDECLLPQQNTEGSSLTSVWPPLVVSTNPELILETDVSEDRIIELLSNDDHVVTFAVTRNLHIRVSISANDEFWSFISHGLYTLGQEEVCILLRRRNGESLPPVDALWHYHLLYDLAFNKEREITRSRGTYASSFPFEDQSCLLLPNPSKHHQNDDSQLDPRASWFDGSCYGFLYTHAVQNQMETLSSLINYFPPPPFLFAVALRSPTEVALTVWQPLRLLLALNHTNGLSVPISDRDRYPVFEGDSATGNSVLCLYSRGRLSYIQIPEMNILSSGLGSSPDEMRLQILLRRSCHEFVRRSLHLATSGENLLLGLGGNFCPSADCHLVVTDSTTGLITDLTPSLSSDRNKNLTIGASFIILQSVEGDRSSLSIVEDGFVVHLTKEQIKALLVHMRSASSMQLRIESTQPLPESLQSRLSDSEHPTTSNNGALITLNWVDESIPMHPTSLHYSCIDGRSVEPRRTFMIPPEHQLRHWLIHQRLFDPEAFADPSLTPPTLPRIAWTHLHSLADRPVYAVDNRSGEVLDFFAVFNAVSATFVNAVLPHSALLRKANHRFVSLRILLQPPNTFNFFIGSNVSISKNRSTRQIPIGLSRDLNDSDWWKVDDVPISQEGIWSPPGPLISEPAYVNGVDTAMIPLLDGLVHNISCSWFFDDAVEQDESSMTEEDELTAPGLVLEFDFGLLD